MVYVKICNTNSTSSIRMVRDLRLWPGAASGLLCLLLAGTGGCNADKTDRQPDAPVTHDTTDAGQPDAGSIELTLRADAVSPARNVDVVYSVGSVEKSQSDVPPGSLFNLGMVPSGTPVVFEVINARDAGQVRANILTNNCFRRTSSCSEPGCRARAEYKVIEEGCVIE